MASLLKLPVTLIVSVLKMIAVWTEPQTTVARLAPLPTVKVSLLMVRAPPVVTLIASAVPVDDVERIAGNAEDVAGAEIVVGVAGHRRQSEVW